MKLLALFIKIITPYIFTKEWLQLRPQLIKSYNYYLKHSRHTSNLLYKLLISGEDHRFFSHGGFDVIAILRAIWKNLAFNKHEGASTIEQQIVRVMTGNYERTIKRKIREIFLATLLCSVVPKRELPGLYLSIAYFGWRMNGLSQACRRLKVNPSFLTLEESASLIARLKYPEPQQITKIRLNQIQRRTIHLISLFKRHSLTKTYIGLNEYDPVQSIKNRTRTQQGLSAAN